MFSIKFENQITAFPNSSWNLELEDENMSHEGKFEDGTFRIRKETNGY